MNLRPAILASILLPASLSADVLVDLDATSLPDGPLVTWSNAGTIGGSFTRQIDAPSVGMVNGVQCVTFDGLNDWYVGPTAPSSVTGAANAVTIEVWAMNPGLADEETLISWGRRGGGDGTNRSFNYGAHPVFGAVGHWGSPDVGWGATSPAAGQWHYLVYTYDGSTARVFADGAPKNSKGVSLNTHAFSTGGAPLPFVIANQNNADGSRTQQGFVGSLSIARVRVKNEVMSPAQIAANYETEGGTFLPPAVQSFDSSATYFAPGQSITLSWETDFGTTVSIDQGVGVVNAGDGSVQVTPPAAETTYTLTATNARGTATAKVTVLPGNPTAENVSVFAPHATAVSVGLVATDPNTPAGSLTYAIVTPPTNGSLTGAGATRTYTPAAGFGGVDTFTYRANDGTSDSNLAMVTITVDPAPADPSDVVLSQADIKTSDTTGSFIARLQAADANAADTHSYALVSGTGDTHNAFFSIVNGQLISQRDFAGDLGQTISIRIRVTDNTGRSFDEVITLPVVERAQNVVINEVHYNPPDNHVPVEFIELHNPLATAVNVGGWRFTDGVDYTFPPSASIPAGGYLVVARDPAALQAVYGVTAFGPWTGGLSSDGERVRLSDHLGAEIDEVDYGINFPWPVPPNGEGPSMELIHPTLDNGRGSSWRASGNPAANITYVGAGSTGWRWRGASSEASSPVTAWRVNGFVENASWSTGTAPFGSNAQALGIAAPATILGSYPAGYRGVFLRKTFNAAGALPKALLLRIYHNDGAIVWLNGQEVARLAVSTSAANPAYNNTQLYDNFTGWSDVVITNADSKLLQGANVLAVQAWGKVPSFRENDTVDDFIIDAELRASPNLSGTPGAVNSVFAMNAAPNIRNVTVTPEQPRAIDPAVVTARVTDPQGVGTVTLHYQVCPPGGFIPAKLPRSTAAILADPFQPRPDNPAFESPANWTTAGMVDDGSGDDAIAGDGIFTAKIPPQINRTLVRYRITVQDLAGASIRTPYADDPSLNFAYFVYNGVPNYVASSASVQPGGAGHVYTANVLTAMPVYHWIMRGTDTTQLMAWNGSDQFPNDDHPRTLAARRYYNHEGAMVYDGKVYDHVDTRLRGGNSRYYYQGKRHMKFRFLKGYYFQARDQDGDEYPTKWQTLLTNKLFGNLGPADWGITQKVDEQIFNLSGAPMPFSHWFHFRVIDAAAEQSDQYNGDFWGLSQGIEDWDARFLEAHDLPKGNLYKLTDFLQDGEVVGRYLAEGAVQHGEDYDNYRYGAHPAQTESWLNTYVDMPQWYRYNAAAEAVRHYDVFPEPTGRHRLKNWIWYFRPEPGHPLGKLVTMPYDLDATFGPTWNNGWDGVHNALYNRVNFGDSPIVSGGAVFKAPMQIAHRNAVRHLRDLLWQPDQLNPMIDDALATIEAFSHADRDRWLNAPSSAGFLPASVQWAAAQKAADMKAFAFSGGNWAQYGGSQPADGNASDNGLSGQQGRDAYLDYFADQTGDAGQLPNRPTITYTGTANYPVDGLSFSSSAFSDPQGPGTFGAMQWRIGEITDPAAPAYNPAAPRIYEMADVWVSAELAAFNATVAIPATALREGHTYRARVRHKDITGRWSHWSTPVQFTASASNYTQVLKENLMVTELLYKPLPPSAAEAGYLEGDFEYIELTNISPSLTLDLTAARFTKGVDFDFEDGAVTSLAPGQRVLVVKNAAAFAARYGAGRLIAGEWDADDALSNGGELVKLSFGAGDPIQEFTYSDSAPWPTAANTGGYSLVLRDPASRPDHNVAANWRASYVAGGNPGGADRTSYSEWSAPHGALDELGDLDKDGWGNLLEYAFAGKVADPASAPAISRGVQSITVNGVPGAYLTLTFRRNAIAEDLIITPEFSGNLTGWSANGVLVSSIPQGDGTVIDTWRAPSPASAEGEMFGRVRVVKP